MKNNSLIMINIDSRKIKLFFIYFIIFILSIINVAYDYSSSKLSIYFAVICFVLPLYFSIEYRKNNVAFLIGLIWLYFNYSVTFSRYFNFLQEYSDFYVKCPDYIMNLSINLFCFFSAILYSIFTRFPKKIKYSSNFFEIEETNILIVISCIMFVLFCSVFGIDMKNFSINGRGEISSLYEYALIGFLFAYIYSGKSKKLKIIISFLAIIYALQGMIFGERIVAMQVLLIMFVFCFSNKIDYKIILVAVIIGILLMVSIGVVRGLSEGESFINAIVEKTQKRYFTFDGMDLSYYCSNTFLMIIPNFSLEERLYYFLKFLMSVFFGFSNVEGAHLGSISLQYYKHYNGGVFPHFFYFYGGWPMVVFAAVILNLLFIKPTKNFYSIDSNHLFTRYLFVLMLISFPRWYVYNPQILLRQIFLYSISFFILKIIDNSLKRKSLVMLYGSK